jgi:hypothetical protein
MKYHTDMRLVFDAMAGRQRDFNWMITELELNVYPPALQYLGGREQPRWFTGTELTQIVDQYELQFVWGVLSAFEPGVNLDLTSVKPYPCADGNADLWRPGVHVQHPLAQLEIVCFDSSCTLVLTHDDALTRRIREYFPEAQDLDVYNEGQAETR